MSGILVVDDHSSTRKALCLLLAENNLDVCGEALDGEDAVEKVRRLKPDIVLLDISMPVMNGIQVAREVRLMAPSTRVIFFTMYEAEETATVLRSLADEVIPKSAARTLLIPAVKRLSEAQI
jgi:two-component system, NarL family, response regulator DegU